MSVPAIFIFGAYKKSKLGRKKDLPWRIAYHHGGEAMYATVWIILSSLLCSLQLSAGSFPKPLTAQEEAHYLELSAKGDLNARNVLIERNLRLVAHIMNKS